VIDRLPFGRTGHQSSRAIFGAAALGSMRQEAADRLLPVLREFGVNHLDTAAVYGDSELRLEPWLRENRDDFFLATKTRARTREEAGAEIERSLTRLGVERVDLLQLHNLVDPDEWAVALGPGGALEAALAARDAGRVRFLGVTGHGTRAAEMHLRSLERFAFDSVLVPCSFALLRDAATAADFDELLAVCRERGVAVQTIKAVARRRWREGDSARRFSWYEPLRDPDAVRRSVRWVLRHPGVFLNTSSDASLLRPTLEAVRDAEAPPADAEMARDVSAQGIEPIFVRGVSDAI